MNLDDFWWAFRDSNPGPTGYEPVALTNCATSPYLFIFFGKHPKKVYQKNVFLSIVFEKFTQKNRLMNIFPFLFQQ